MDSISTDVWKRKGSAVVFNQSSLAPLISSGAIISLRTFLSWSDKLPENVPVPEKTVLVCGLETIIETMEPLDASDFLARRIRPLLTDIQNRWTGIGVVFGFTAHPKTFEENSFSEEILFKRRDRKKVRLSDGLWDGSAGFNLRRIVRETNAQTSEITLGYYVSRIS